MVGYLKDDSLSFSSSSDIRLEASSDLKIEVIRLVRLIKKKKYRVGGVNYFCVFSCKGVNFKLHLTNGLIAKILSRALPRVILYPTIKSSS